MTEEPSATTGGAHAAPAPSLFDLFQQRPGVQSQLNADRDAAEGVVDIFGAEYVRRLAHMDPAYQVWVNQRLTEDLRRLAPLPGETVADGSAIEQFQRTHGLTPAPVPPALPPTPTAPQIDVTRLHQVAAALLPSADSATQIAFVTLIEGLRSGRYELVQGRNTLYLNDSQRRASHTDRPAAETRTGGDQRPARTERPSRSTDRSNSDGDRRSAHEAVQGEPVVQPAPAEDDTLAGGLPRVPRGTTYPVPGRRPASNGPLDI